MHETITVARTARPSEHGCIQYVPFALTKEAFPTRVRAPRNSAVFLGSTPSMIRISLALAVITASITTTVWMSRLAKTTPIGWDHWDVVQPGVLYRSGQLRPEQLELAIQGYGLRTVV